MTFPILPEQASRVAAQTDRLYWGLICLSVIACLVVFVPMFYFVLKYREGKPANRAPLKLPETSIEITWTVSALLIFVGC